jgi:MFS family permease
LFIGSGMQPQMPEFALDLGVDQAGLVYGFLLSANSAGAVIGGMLLEGTRRLQPSPRGAMISALVWSLCIMGFAASRSYGLSLALLLVAGAANLSAQSMSQTLVQLLAPAEKRGRVIGVYHMASAGLRAGSGVTIGLVGWAIGIHWSLALSSACLAVIVLGLLWLTNNSAATEHADETAHSARPVRVGQP